MRWHLEDERIRNRTEQGRQRKLPAQHCQPHQEHQQVEGRDKQSYLDVRFLFPPLPH